MGEPTVRELTCPWCEWSGRTARKDEDPDSMYFFFPGGVAAMVSDDVKPLFPEDR